MINKPIAIIPRYFLLNEPILLCIIIILTTFGANGQQDPQFSQNRFNLLTVNPGYAGSSDMINASLLNRSQWIGFPGAPVTSVFNVETKVRLIGENDGIGFSVMNDVIGFEKNISVALDYSWRTKVWNGLLGTGLSVGVLNKNLNVNITGIDGGDLVNLTDPSLPQEEANGVLVDIGVGVYWRGKNLYLALSTRHLNQPEMFFDQSGNYTVTRSYYFTSGYTIKTGDERFEFLPSIFFKSDAVATQADLNIEVQYEKRYWGGIGIRPGDAIIINAGTELWNGIKLGYSYDINTSSLSRYNSGSHEIFVSYSVKFNKKKRHEYKSVRFL